MTNLNEDVLRHIFSYLDTPLDWIQVSQVCQLWKKAASKQWRKMTEICYLRTDLDKKLNYHSFKNVPVISAKDASMIVYFAAPFVNVLSASMDVSERGNVRVMFGSFLYKVRGFKAESTLKLLAENSVNLTEFRCDKQPKIKLLKLLVERNKIKKVQFGDSSSFYEDIPTEEIEELNLCFNEPDGIKSFDGHFPKLQKLVLKVDCKHLIEPQQVLSQILPFVSEVTLFHLRLKSMPRRPISCNVLSDVAKFAHLENLSLKLQKSNVTNVDLFINQLVTSCPRLRSLKLMKMEISETGIQTLLSLPQLKILDVATVQSFNEVELQEISSLVKLRMEYDYGGFDDTNFCNVLKKMPELEILEMNIDLKAHKDEYQVFYGNEFLDLVCGAATVAASQNKELVVQQISPNEFATKLRIAKKNAVPDEVVRTLTLKIAFRERLGLLEDVEDFVQTDLKSHYTVIEEE